MPSPSYIDPTPGMAVYPIAAPAAVVVVQWRADSGVIVTAAMCGSHDVIHQQAYAQHDGYIWRHYIGPDDAAARCSFCDPLTRVAWSAGVDTDELEAAP